MIVTVEVAPTAGVNVTVSTNEVVLVEVSANVYETKPLASVNIVGMTVVALRPAIAALTEIFGSALPNWSRTSTVNLLDEATPARIDMLFASNDVFE